MRTMPVLATATMMLAAPMLAPAAQAAHAVKFSRWVVDLPGNDKVTAANLNKEYITLTNTTAKTITIGGYRVSDRGSKHVYVIPKGFKLGAKKSVVIRSGQGKNSSTTLYWGQAVKGLKPVSRNSFVWNNSGETATLRNAAGKAVHVCTYKKNKSGSTSC